MVNPPLPLRLPERPIFPPVVSIVPGPLPVRFMASDEDHGALAPSVPPPKLNVAEPDPCAKPDEERPTDRR